MSEPGASRPIPPWWTDPTENVKVLVEASDRRQDDLRGEAISSLRREMELRAHYEGLLRVAESARIDAIRSVDVAAVQRAAEVQNTQQQVLAQQVTATAEAFRTSLTSALAPIQTSIEDLRRAQYEAQGQKTQVVEAQADRSGVQASLGIYVTIGLLLVAVISLVLLYATK
jgi:hypothetical protein